MNIYSTVIIENEKKTMNLLRFYLKEYCPEVRISAISNTIYEGIKRINKYKPDIVFFDIDIHDDNRYFILDLMDNINFEVIVTTANRNQDNYSFDFNAMHFLLKPFNPIDLRKVINRAIQNKTAQDHMSEMLSGNKTNNSGYIYSKFNRVLTNIKIEDILLIESRQNGSTIVLKSGRKIKSAEPLRHYEIELLNSGFFRANRSYLINIAYINKLDSSNNCHTVEMKDGTIVYLPSGRKSDLSKLIQDLNLFL